MDVAIPILQSNQTTITNVSDLSNILLRIKQLQTTEKGDISQLTDSVSGPVPSVKKQPKGKEKEVVIPAVDKDIPVNIIEAVIAQVNPLLFQFGKNNNISTQDLLKYASLLKEYYIEPTVMAEFVKSQHNLTDSKPKGHEVRGYQNIQDKNHDAYISLILGVFKELFDQVNNTKTQSPLSNTHVDILHNQVTDQQQTIQYGKLFTIAHGLVTAGFAIWASYNQAHNAICTGVNGTIPL
jgi:hypothetical protein